ncbi:TIGR02594 family protein [Niveispirillum sp. KHB5.9]|uniref:NlpC/P60 family protein n=1 Tax=Niveispirillum sp. KHB5.9 TaxID=3400269 RepID=UPI003A8BB81D
MTGTLSLGSQGPEVRVMQALLNMHGGLPAPVPENGIFDAETTKGVAAFQRSRHLEGTGLYSGDTRLALVGKPPAGAARGGWPAPWMDIAVAEEAAGVQENPSKTIHNPRIVEYHAATTFKAANDEEAWCSSFANWVLGKAGYRVDRNAGAASWKSWGVSVLPRYGAITVVRSPGGHHVGFFVDAPPGKVRLLGGNQGDIGLGRVKESNFPPNQIVAIRWPAPGDEPGHR